MLNSYATYRYYSMRFQMNRTITIPDSLYKKLVAKYKKELSENDTFIPSYNNADEYIEDYLSLHY